MATFPIPDPPGLAVASYCVLGWYASPASAAQKRSQGASFSDYVVHLCMLSFGRSAFQTIDHVNRSSCDHIVPRPPNLPLNTLVRNDPRRHDLVGYVGSNPQAHLTPTQIQYISRELAYLSKKALTRYIAHPAIEVYRDPVNNRNIGYKFSCVGLVLHCYSKAGINLICQELPGTSAVCWTRDELRTIYGHLNINWNDWAELTALGLTPQTHPWPILLPGYVLWALDGIPHPQTDRSRAKF